MVLVVSGGVLVSGVLVSGEGVTGVLVAGVSVSGVGDTRCRCFLLLDRGISIGCGISISRRGGGCGWGIGGIGGGCIGCG